MHSLDKPLLAPLLSSASPPAVSPLSLSALLNVTQARQDFFSLFFFFTFGPQVSAKTLARASSYASHSPSRNNPSLLPPRLPSQRAASRNPALAITERAEKSRCFHRCVELNHNRARLGQRAPDLDGVVRVCSVLYFAF